MHVHVHFVRESERPGDILKLQSEGCKRRTREGELERRESSKGEGREADERVTWMILTQIHCTHV